MFNARRVLVGEDENILEMDGGDNSVSRLDPTKLCVLKQLKW